MEQRFCAGCHMLRDLDEMGFVRDLYRCKKCREPKKVKPRVKAPKLTLECPECKSKLVITDPNTVQALDTCCEVRCPLCDGSEFLGPPFMVIVEN
jgi:hypothetical protein